MSQKSALGRGLDAILIDNEADSSSRGKVLLLRISSVEPNRNQPRRNFDAQALAALADSIRQYGVLQPITVTESDGGYSIVAGERRWRAARMAGLSEIPAIVIDSDTARAAELTLVENIQREDLNPVEEARGIDQLRRNFGYTQDQIAQKLGRSRSAVANSLRLLELPEPVLALIESGELSSGHAKVLLSVADRALIPQVAELVVKGGLSVRDTEKLVKKINNRRDEPEKPVPAVDYARNVEDIVRSALGRTVRLSESGGVRRISIEYSDNRDLEKLLILLCGEDILKRL